MEALATKYRPRTFKDVVCQDNIKKEWIDTVRKEAFEMNRTDWAIVFDFGVLGDEYAVIPLNDYKEFLEYKRGNK